MSNDLKIGDIIGDREIIDIIYEPIKSKNNKLGRVYVTKCLRCGKISKECAFRRLNYAKCENCKYAIEWNGQWFSNQKDMAEKLGVSKRSIVLWARLHNKDFSEYTIEWSKGLVKGNIPNKHKYHVGDVVGCYEIIDTISNNKRYGYKVKCIHCGKITKKGSDDLTQYKCRCRYIKKYKIGDVVNGRKLIGMKDRYYCWQCLDCGKITQGHISYAERVVCSCKQSNLLAEKQLNRTTPSGLRVNDLPKNIHYKSPRTKANRYSFCATVQARYNGIRKGFYYDNQDIGACLEALPILRMLAHYYKKTGKHISYGQYIEMGKPELKV